jgi:hypothetical protein
LDNEHDAAQDHAASPTQPSVTREPLGDLTKESPGPAASERELPQSRSGVEIGVLLVGFCDVDRIGQRAGEEQANSTASTLTRRQPICSRSARQPEDQRPDQEDWPCTHTTKNLEGEASDSSAA